MRKPRKYERKVLAVPSSEASRSFTVVVGLDVARKPMSRDLQGLGRGTRKMRKGRG